MIQDYSKNMARLPDSELLHILENHTDINPDAILAAKAEWEKRGLADSNLEEIRQRRKAVESMHQRHTLSLPNSVTNDWAKFTAWVHRQHPNRQLLIWICLIYLGISTYSAIISIRNLHDTISYYGPIDWYIIFAVITTLSGIALNYLSVIYLIKLKKWAYWFVTFSLTLSFCRDILMLPFDAYEKWLVTFDPYYPLASHITVETLVFSFFTGISTTIGLLILYLLIQNNVREQYGTTAITLKRLLLVGALLGVAAGAMDIYNWWTWTPLFHWF